MKRYLTTFVAVAMLVGLGLTIGCQRAVEPANDVVEPPPDVPPEDLSALVDGNNQFALDLYKKLAETEKGNIFFSPYSISSALAMTYAGARGQTAEEMAKVLGIAKLGDKVHPAHASLAYKLKSAGGKDKPEFHIANALWGQQGLPFKPEFLQLTRRHYGAGLQEVNFGDTENARGTINRWVGDQTREKIPELLKPGVLSNDTKLVLTNAIYFKADWLHPFEKTSTKAGPFHRTPTETVTVPFMHQKASFRVAWDGQVGVLELPYVGGEYAMLVVLPNKPEDLNRVQAGLTSESIAGWLGKAMAHKYDIMLPKFKMQMAANLVPALQQLGMTTAFKSIEADFSNCEESKQMFIASIEHQATIDVDEFGTTAAAATEVSMSYASSGPQFVVNRPFLVVIRSKQTGAIVFVGKVMNPKA